MTVLAGADAWEQLQLRQRQLAIAQVLPLSSDGKTTAPDKPHDQPEPWEDDLGEKWVLALPNSTRSGSGRKISTASTDPASDVNASRRREV